MRNRRTGQRDTGNGDRPRTEYNVPGRRPWFGPKRFGYGLAPRTWQGYLITAAGVLAIVLISALTRGHSRIFLIAIPVGLILLAKALSRPR
jgi:hypothetical protein